MKLVVLGLSLSSSWGNGHATTYRALLKAFASRGHEVLFLERDKPWYASHRDLTDPDYCRLAFYDSVEALEGWSDEVAGADAVIVGSYVPDGVEVGRWVQATASGVTAFYDIDTPVTLARIAAGDTEYITPELIPGYDVYLSFSGGPALQLLEERYGSPAARALYCSVDIDAYRPIDGVEPVWALSYLGTYSPDRQPGLERLLLEPARQAPELRFAVAGPGYPDGIVWPENVDRIDHLPPADHRAFYARSQFTLNVTREDMIRLGYSPSVRLFEAAACGTPVISDRWEGLDELFEPDREIILADDTATVLRTLRGSSEARRRGIGGAARERILGEHTALHRALQLERWLRQAEAARPSRAEQAAPHIQSVLQG